jgi:FixJ family two-component response regulator
MNEAPHAETAAVEAPARPAPTPLQKIKRRGRSIVLFGTDDETSSKLETLLLAEGYGKVSCPQSMEELLDCAPVGGAGVILLDLDMPFEQCLTIAGSVLAHIEDETPLVLVTSDLQLGVEAVLDAQNVGISAILPKPLKIDDSFFNKLEDVMGIAAG